MKKYLLLLIILTLALVGKSQSIPFFSDSVFVAPEVSPEYKGGYEAMMRDLQKRMYYPMAARKAGIEGIVYVQFIVDKNGKPKNCKVIKGIDKQCDAVAVRAAQSLRKWTPGSHHGEPIEALFVLPVQFRLN
jgi:protein TonB